jgi:thymidylate synthase (FAD)
MKITSTYGAELINVMGDDLTVVNAARVSFDKESEWEYLRYTSDPDDYGIRYDLCAGATLSDKDAKLIKYLAEHNHWSPFAHPQLSFRVKAPIFVARQFGKHQVGLAWNEVSRRYVDSEPEFYVPEGWRERAENVKQGSADHYREAPWMTLDYKELLDVAYSVYEDMLYHKVCPEQARMVLPQSMMTEWVWTGSLYAFARVCKQRLDIHAQRECYPIANDIANHIRCSFPVSAGYLLG